jgi:hypothetical protein
LRAVDLFDAAVEVRQEYSVTMAQGLTISHPIRFSVYLLFATILRQNVLSTSANRNPWDLLTFLLLPLGARLSLPRLSLIAHSCRVSLQGPGTCSVLGEAFAIANWLLIIRRRRRRRTCRWRVRFAGKGILRVGRRCVCRNPG